MGLRNLLGKGKRGQIAERWKFDSKTSLLAGPAVARLEKNETRKIVFGTNDGKIYTLDSEGRILWIFDAKENVSQAEMMFYDQETVNSIQSPPVIYDINGDGDNEIIFGTEMGVVYALNPQGKALWKFKCEGSVRGGILIKDIDNDGKPEMIFGSGDGKLYILGGSGDIKQQFDIECPIESTPQSHEDKIIFGCNDGHIICINYSGKEEWRFKTEEKIIAQATIGKIYGDDKNYIIIGSVDHHIYTLDMSGELTWKYKTEGAIYSKASLADINKDNNLEIIFGSCDNSIYALKSNGEIIWSYETDFWVVAPVIVDDIDKDGELEIIAGSYDHNIYILDAKGNYMLDYVPGLSGIMHQSGAYTDVVTAEPGKTTGKKLWQYQADGIVVGCAYINETKNIVVNTRPGKVDTLQHQ